MWSLVTGFFHIACFPGSSMLWHVSVPFFLLMNNVLLYGYTIFYLSICLVFLCSSFLLLVFYFRPCFGKASLGNLSPFTSGTWFSWVLVSLIFGTVDTGFLFSSVITETSMWPHDQYRPPVSNTAPNNLQDMPGNIKILLFFCFPDSASHICVITVSGSVLN